MTRNTRCTLFTAALSLFAADAAAICLLGHPTEVYIGDKAGDSYCTYDSIQDALNATYTCPTTVRITREHTYTSQHLTLNGTSQPLTLQGEADGVTCDQLAHCSFFDSTHCHAATTQPLVTLDGSNTEGHVLTITGNANVTLHDLTIMRGSADVFVVGGGIEFDGTGSLYLDTTTVSLNYARYGGGINVNGNGGAATLTLGPNSLVLNNTAQYDGGGIRLTGQARLFALQPQTLIGYNQANGYGGGVAVVGPARADIDSPGFNGSPAVSFNSAQSGGGIAVIENGSGEAVLREFATGASQPTAIADNTATGNGGGIFVRGQADACLFAPYLTNNIGFDGAAIYYDLNNAATRGGVFINGGSPARLGADCGPELVTDLGGSKDCRPYDAQCNAFADNAAQDGTGTTNTGGAIITMLGGDLAATRFRLRTSTAGYAINDFAYDAVVNRCLITDNQLSNYLMQGYSATFHNCTIANNFIEGAYVFWFNEYPTKLDLANDIIDQPGTYAAYWDSRGGGQFTVGYVLSNNTAGLPSSNPSIVQGLPTFVDAAHGDYHLAPVAQKALDFGNTGVVDYDLDGGPPDVDLNGIPNFLGTGDLGAYERQNLFLNCGTSDSVFCTNFETP